MKTPEDYNMESVGKFIGVTCVVSVVVYLLLMLLINYDIIDILYVMSLVGI